MPENKLNDNAIAVEAVDNAAPNESPFTIDNNGFYIDNEGVVLHYWGGEESVVLPKGVKIISDSAFKGNISVVSVIIPEGVEIIENEVFCECYNLREVVLPSTIKEIGDSAFYETGLSEIIIPEGCEKIGGCCFYRCADLKDIYVPASVYDIGDMALTTYNDDTVIHTSRYSVADRCARSDDQKIEYDDTVDKTVTVTRDGYVIKNGDTFIGYTGNDSKIILPRGIKKIGHYALTNNCKVNSVSLPEGLEIIGSHAFQGCERISVIYLPSTLKKIGAYAFCDSGITKIAIPGGVESIEHYTFNGCFFLTEVTIPGTVRRIGSCAFSGTCLMRLVIPEGVEVIESSAFDNCVNLFRVTLPSTIRQIESYAFAYTGLVEIVIPDECDSVGVRCFVGCINLKNIYIPANIRRIDADAFKTGNPETVIHEEDRSIVICLKDSCYDEVNKEKKTGGSTAQLYQTANKKDGCYVATAVYGSYDAPQVRTLRRFRDETLKNTAYGRLFIRAYYRFSPPVAERLKNAKYINRFVRSLLDRWVKYLDK